MMPQPMDPRQAQLAQEKMIVAQTVARVMWLTKREEWLTGWVEEFRFVYGAQTTHTNAKNEDALMLYVKFEMSKMNTELDEVKEEKFKLQGALDRHANKSSLVTPVFVPPGRLS